MQKKDQQNHNKKGISRRDMLAGLASIPILGALGYGLYRHQMDKLQYKNGILKSLKPVIPKGIPPLIEGKVLRIGVIGTGGRGDYIMKSLGLVMPERIDDWKKRGKESKWWVEYLDAFMQQEDLHIKVTAICDVFDKNAAKGMRAGANQFRNGSEGKQAEMPKRFQTYQELVASPEVDAVIIATPDHLHVPMAIAAAKLGKHVYCEKPLSWTVAETFEVRKIVKDSGIVFQLGHQGRQTESYQVARSLLQQEAIGKISLIEVCTNRNDPNGAWVYDIDPEANSSNIDWKQFIGPAPWHDFSLERFFRWRCWWDYSTGLSGDLFTHEFDAINQLLDLGIPHSAMASGGIYFYKDGRTVPDVLNMAFEYPQRDLTLLYSATLSSEKDRGKSIMGHDGWMELGDNLLVYPDPRSTKYKQELENGSISEGKPIFSYVPGQEQIDAITTPTEQYFAGRGLLYTFRNGKAIDTTHLHLREWINCIRMADGTQPSCNIDQAFEEAITAHMGTIAFHEKRQTFWDAANETIF